MSKKTIILKSLTLTNFKGVKSLSVPFEQITNIYGNNATGKTTIFDAFTFLLFGKDSADRKDFEVKTLDAAGIPIPKIEHEVSAVILVDGNETTLRRILKEKWVKKQGSEVAEFTGNETLYYWNEVPMLQKDYQAKVNSVLDEVVFKLITSPSAFNTMKWQDRRNVLTQIAGSLTDTEIATGNPAFEKLLEDAKNCKDLEEYKRMIAASIKKAKDDIKAIPTRIDEVEKGKPEAADFDTITNDIAAKEKEVVKLDDQLQNASTAFDAKLLEINQRKTVANNLNNDIAIIEAEARKEAAKSQTVDTSVLDGFRTALTTKEGELSTAEGALKTLETKAAGIVNEVKALDAKIEGKRSDWNAENEKTLVFAPDSFCCPTCSRDFEASDIEAKKTEMMAAFKTAKTARLLEITNAGKDLASLKTVSENELSGINTRIETGKAIIATLKAEIAMIKADIDTENEKASDNETPDENLVYESILSLNASYSKKKNELAAMLATIEEMPAVDNTELKTQKSALQAEINQLKEQLSAKTQIEAANARIAELMAEEKTLAAQIANVEKTQFVIDNFNKCKIDALEKNINARFKYVSFKMFDTLINGGVEECCEALVDGVPYSDLNTASKINAGIDIINTLGDFYGISAPVFLDNRESTVNIIDTDSQLVNLFVEKGAELSVGRPKYTVAYLKSIGKTQDQMDEMFVSELQVA